MRQITTMNELESVPNDSAIAITMPGQPIARWTKVAEGLSRNGITMPLAHFALALREHVALLDGSGILCGTWLHDAGNHRFWIVDGIDNEGTMQALRVNRYGTIEAWDTAVRWRDYEEATDHDMRNVERAYRSIADGIMARMATLAPVVTGIPIVDAQAFVGENPDATALGLLQNFGIWPQVEVVVHVEAQVQRPLAEAQKNEGMMIPAGTPVVYDETFDVTFTTDDDGVCACSKVTGDMVRRQVASEASAVVIDYTTTSCSRD